MGCEPSLCLSAAVKKDAGLNPKYWAMVLARAVGAEFFRVRVFGLFSSASSYPFIQRLFSFGYGEASERTVRLYPAVVYR